MSRLFRELFEDDDGGEPSSSRLSTILTSNSTAIEPRFTLTGSADESTLDSSTVPTYEEFLKKSRTKLLPPPSTLTQIREPVINLVTDDESSNSSESDDDNETIIKPKPALMPIKPALVINKTPVKSLSPCKTPRTANKTDSRPEYVYYNDKTAQTSFNSPDVVNDTVNESPEPQPDFEKIKQKNLSQFGLSNVTMRKNNTSSRKSNKRISICGDGLSENVLNIDDTIIDQFENEQDYKSGKLFTMTEEDIEKDLLSSTKVCGSFKLFLDEDEEEEKEKTVKTKKKESSSDDDRFETFLNDIRAKQKPKEVGKVGQNELKKFIVDDEDVIEIDATPSKKKTTRRVRRNLNKEDSSSSSKSSEELEDEEELNQYNRDLQLFYIKTTNKINDFRTPKTKTNSGSSIKKSSSKVSRSSLLDDLSGSSDSSPTVFTIDSSSSDSDDHLSGVFRNKINIDDRSKTPSYSSSKLYSESRLIKTGIKSNVVKKVRQVELTFIESLSTNVDENHIRDPKAAKYLQKFNQKKIRDELLLECFAQFNKAAFDNKLPGDMLVKWNPRLTSTGGYCKNSITFEGRQCQIDISSKVCDSPERMRDTLAHEMCHAAAFLIDGVRDGHGQIWRGWANRVNCTFPRIPQITITHAYSIKKKYIYKCQKCGQEIHRFSKSIDVEKELCGICHGRFEIMVNSNDQNGTTTANAKEPKTPRQPSKFALYVKENYHSIKKDNQLGSHKDIMQELSKQFKLLDTR